MTLVLIIILTIVAVVVFKIALDEEYNRLEEQVLKELELENWDVVTYFDEYVTVNSRQALKNYNDIKFFKENKEKLVCAENIINKKNKITVTLNKFLSSNSYKSHSQYSRIAEKIDDILKNASAYRISVKYISYAGNTVVSTEISIKKDRINQFKNDPSLLMGKGEYNKYLKEQQKEAVQQKQHNYYEQVNRIIDYANKNREFLIINNSQKQLDNLIAQLFDRTINSIKKIKYIDSDEWALIADFIAYIKDEIEKVVDINHQILEYYNSPNFAKIKETCEVLMSTQREFNEYITKKAQAVSKLFGVRVIRNETLNTDEYNYIRPYKKAITPFTAEVSAAVFASAENNPLEYVVKNFYPNKKLYPEQIQKLYYLVEELETLKDAKQIIENYKTEYQQYLVNVPRFVIDNDEAGFYSRLGFANIDESVLGVEYKFSYTSGGGMAQRSFTVPMTEETIAELINVLESKLTTGTFAKEQRALMTKKLREFIKNRDNFTCCNCGNSTYKEPNLLLEIDHIIPVTKGGCTVKENLQTLCWKCNRAKGDKIVS